MRLFIPLLIITSILLGSITTGKIVDTDGNPIRGVTVSHQNTYTYTDKDGTFRLKSTGQGLLSAEHIGFQTESVVHSDYVRIVMQAKTILTDDVLLVSQIGSTSLKEVNSSITIFEPEDIKNIESDHLESHLHQISNLNWSGASSRPRYFQIRGIGEKSLYTGEGPPNFSVGFSMDDIDLSGIGMAAMMFDINQVEVLKGAQSSVFGPNALAGTISLKSNDPKPFWGMTAILGYGSDNNQRLGLVANTPLSSKIMLRTGIFYSYGDGFRQNIFLNTSDSNSNTETMLRTKLNWLISKRLNMKMSILTSLSDNKYDVWSPDNNEDLITYTDRQGYDTQDLSAISIKSSYRFMSGHKILSISSKSQSSMKHSYDGDWGNNSFWENDPYNWDSDYNGYSYDFFDASKRERVTISNEIRLLSPNKGKNIYNYAIGFYQRSLKESDKMSGYVFTGDIDHFDGEFTLSNFAIYSKFNILLEQAIGFDFSWRAESAWLDYEASSLKDLDYDGIYETSYSTSVSDRAELLTAIKAVAYYDINENERAYVSVSNGYKAGGVNQNPFIADPNRYYDPEQNINFEIGYKTFKENSSYQATLFYMLRENLQVNVSSQQNPGNPNSFYYFTSNAGSGHNYGAEIEGSHILFNNKLKLTSSIGYLETWIDKYEFYTSDTEITIRGNRDQSQSPELTCSMVADIMPTKEITLRVDYSLKESYYLSDSHDFKSDAYQLLNLSASYKLNSMLISIWAKNIIDVRYPVRGFYFGLEPNDFTEKLYLQWGDPFQIGLTLRYEI